jgi:Xaa-Pro dipeptidase
LALHFTESELAGRRAATMAAMAANDLDGMLLFRQESLYYLTGYDTFGYVFFQCLYLGADGTMTLLTRAPDLRQARHTSVVEDIRVWVDGADVDPTEDLVDILAEHGCRGARLGIEWDSYGLTAANGRRLTAALDGFCDCDDASDLVSRQRLVKSDAELDYVRRAAALADDALDAAIREAGPGAFEGDILAAMQSAVFRGGGDDPANETIIGSGPDALLCRYHTGRRNLDIEDQLTLEFAGVYRHYHACLMRTFCIGTVPPRQQAMFDLASEALAAVKEALHPGRPIGDAFAAHARVFDAAGHQAHRLNACGYSLGTTFAPNWMDWPMLYQGNSVEAEPNMVFFAHMILFDDDAGLAMTLGETVVITETGCTPLSRRSLELIVK